MQRKANKVAAGIVSVLALGALAESCRTIDSGAQSGVESSPISAADYDNNPAYVDVISDTADVKDEVALAPLDESNVFDGKNIASDLDHRLDMLTGPGSVAEVEAKSSSPAGTFASGTFSPRAYQDALAKAGRPTHKFAAASVLAAMRRMRRFFYTAPFSVGATSVFAMHLDETGKLVEGAAGIPRDAFPSVTSYPPTKLSSNPSADRVFQKLTVNGGGGADFKTPFDEFQMTWNKEGFGNDGNNLYVMPIFWDDIQAAFYVEPPHRRHGCWTMSIIGPGTTAAGFAGVWKNDPTPDLHLSRVATRDICTGRVFLRKEYGNFPLQQWGQAIPAIPVQMSAYNLMWVNPKTHAFVTPPDAIRNDLGASMMLPFQAAMAAPTDPAKTEALYKAIADLPGVQWAEKQRENGLVNMWDYIMMHRLYAWDRDQERAVMMAFFSDNKMAPRLDATGKVGPGDTTPITSPADCATWFVKRPGDMAGTSCDANKVQTRDNRGNQGPFSVGR